jgi:gluconolactonase
MNRTNVLLKTGTGPLSVLLLLAIVPTAWTQNPQTSPPQYQPSADSKPQPGVPKGEVLKFSFDHSKVFPGTYRDYWVYVPAEYTAEKPACVYVNQDGLRYEAPTVFDNLIYKKEMPVTIGVFVMHGRVRAADENTALDRFNRSYEYDGLGDKYARFLLEELLPEVGTKKTSDGRPIRLSHSGNDRAIGGESSGAICAFTAAWERPEAFTRVFSAIGTYVGLRGGERYPTLIRKYEPKPLRVFLQDGSGDLNIYGGDWWMANQTMERALEFAGYEVQHVWGEGGHNGNHATAVFPDAMRWLWKDWPQPVKSGATKNAMLAALLIPGEEWSMAGEGYKAAGGLAANANGEVVFTDAPEGRTYRIGRDAKVTLSPSGAEKVSWQAFGPSGELYSVLSADAKIIVRDPTGKSVHVAGRISGEGIVVAHNGNTYVCQPAAAGHRNQVRSGWLNPEVKNASSTPSKVTQAASPCPRTRRCSTWAMRALTGCTASRFLQMARLRSSSDITGCTFLTVMTTAAREVCARTAKGGFMWPPVWASKSATRQGGSIALFPHLMVRSRIYASVVRTTTRSLPPAEIEFISASLRRRAQTLGPNRRNHQLRSCRLRRLPAFPNLRQAPRVWPA